MEVPDNNSPTAPTESKLPPIPPAGHAFAEKPGDWIGPYKLMEVIGEGGFGTVWLAERREPMVQRVAIKIIKPGMDSKAVIARFEQERQALAVMDHPNVAKVLDGGVTPTGRPYFVMEHVKGEPITNFADRNRLTLRQRLELFIPVCEAVQHAHLKGIIHRDIKPSNILVTNVGDEDATDAAATRGMLVKVIDFGVAKAISRTLTDKTIFTEQGQIIGTPEYMSPEQAEMGATDIDIRSDVYSLGVVLYELLCGTVPFESKSLRSAGYAEIQRIIREVDPPRPSTRFSSADQKTGSEVARLRQADRDKLVVELRRELEWIPMKALRKDRRERYTMARDLAEDVRRYLAGSALEAGPASQWYRLKKLVLFGPRMTDSFLFLAGFLSYSILPALLLPRPFGFELSIFHPLIFGTLLFAAMCAAGVHGFVLRDLLKRPTSVSKQLAAAAAVMATGAFISGALGTMPSLMPSRLAFVPVHLALFYLAHVPILKYLYGSSWATALSSYCLTSTGTFVAGFYSFGGGAALCIVRALVAGQL